MKSEDKSVSRRHFLAAAALGGLLTGTARAADDKKAPEKKPEEKPEKKEEGSPILQDKHVCRGINTCKGKGKGGDNDCAGKGKCATASAHSCGGKNECKGQGGCGAKPGENACKGKGACHVPLMDEKTWKKARTAFEAAMKKAGKTVGPAPAAAK